MNQNTSSAMQIVTTQNEQKKVATSREAFEEEAQGLDLDD